MSGAAASVLILLPGRNGSALRGAAPSVGRPVRAPLGGKQLEAGGVADYDVGRGAVRDMAAVEQWPTGERRPQLDSALQGGVRMP